VTAEGGLAFGKKKSSSPPRTTSWIKQHAFLELDGPTVVHGGHGCAFENDAHMLHGASGQPARAANMFLTISIQVRTSPDRSSGRRSG
jgi:hypothetical protein